MVARPKKSFSSALIFLMLGLLIVLAGHFGVAQTPPTVNLSSPQINGLTVSINGGTFPTTSGATVTQISFDWGNGVKSVGWFPQSYTYLQNGTYTIAVTSTDSNGLSGSATTTVTVSGVPPSPQPIINPTSYTAQDFPISISYNMYTGVGASKVFNSNPVSPGPAAISLGILNGSVNLQVLQGSQLIISTVVTGGSFDYIVISGPNSYVYGNFYSNGQPIVITATSLSGQPLIAYNLYNNYITNYTASLITYPPQFAANFSPATTPTNTGISFLLVAPTYAQPTPLAIWVAEGYTNPQTGSEWYAQIGFNNWSGSDNVSYAGWGIFSNIFGNPGGTDLNYPLIPGDTYNFTMALAYGTTWEFLVNGTLIPEPGLSGAFDTTTTSCNEGADLGLETLTAWGGNVAITNTISIPMVMSFQVNGQWTEPSSFSFVNVGENWWNGNATGASGIDLWGVAGNLQDSSVPVGAMLFNDSLPMIQYTSGMSSEPIYDDSNTPTPTPTTSTSASPTSTPLVQCTPSPQASTFPSGSSTSAAPTVSPMGTPEIPEFPLVAIAVVLLVVSTTMSLARVCRCRQKTR